MEKQEEVPADLCIGIWQGRGARPGKQAWNDGDGTGWKHSSHSPSPLEQNCTSTLACGAQGVWGRVASQPVLSARPTTSSQEERTVL